MEQVNLQSYIEYRIYRISYLMGKEKLLGEGSFTGICSIEDNYG